MPRNHREEGPHFIGVGPEKTGTTWIHSNLRAHPRVIVPPLKELRYFWENANFPNEKLSSRFRRSDSWHRDQYRDYFRRFIKRYSRNPARFFSSKRFMWDCRYLFSKHDDGWYLGCFDRREGFVCGEISPQYFFLPETEIKHISNLLPDGRIIISLREPVDWFWSFIRMIMRVNKRQLDAEAFDVILNTHVSKRRFSRAFRYWKRHFSEDQLLVVFYDELLASPWQFYYRICDFLRIAPDPARVSRLTERVNEGNALEIPETFKAKIEIAWRDDMEELSSMLPTMPQSWKRSWQSPKALRRT
jgi:hypothetical protein